VKTIWNFKYPLYAQSSWRWFAASRTLNREGVYIAATVLREYSGTLKSPNPDMWMAATLWSNQVEETVALAPLPMAVWASDVMARS